MNDPWRTELTEAAIAWHAYHSPLTSPYDDGIQARVARNELLRKADQRLHAAVTALLNET